MPPWKRDQLNAGATSETIRTWKTIHTIHTRIHIKKANMKGWLWRLNYIHGPCGLIFLTFVLQVRKNPEIPHPENLSRPLASYFRYVHTKAGPWLRPLTKTNARLTWLSEGRGKNLSGTHTKDQSVIDRLSCRNKVLTLMSERQKGHLWKGWVKERYATCGPP